MIHLASPGVRNLLAVANSGQNHQTPPGVYIVQFTCPRIWNRRYCDFSSNIGIWGSQSVYITKFEIGIAYFCLIQDLWMVFGRFFYICGQEVFNILWMRIIDICQREVYNICGFDLKCSPKAVHEGPFVCGVFLGKVIQAVKWKVKVNQAEKWK